MLVDTAHSKRFTPKRERPDFKDYGIAKSPKGLMDWAWADEQLTKARNYWIASTRADGRPHVAPVWGVWFDGAVYFSSARSSIKAQNLSARPDVVIHLESGDDVVIFEGRAIEVKDEAVMAKVGPVYEAKYGMGDISLNESSAWFAIAPRSALGWLEKDFPNTATRWVFEDGGR
jgi:hypothetical protein